MMGHRFFTYLAAVLGAISVCVSTPGGGVQAAGLLLPAGSTEELQIHEQDVSVVVQDGYAITRIEQVFANPHGSDLEAKYSFPVPDKAAVSEFTYWIDGQPVTGEVLPKAKAREVYETEKQAGREAAITEQDSHKTFDMTVWPVRAQQDVRIRLVYIQPVHVDTGMGRYVYPLEEGGVDEEKLSFWTANERVDGRFRFELTLRSGVPVAAVRLPDHPGAIIRQASESEWTVVIERGGAEGAEEGAPVAAAPAFRLDKDIVVYWRHKAGVPGRVELIAHRPESDKPGTFMMTVTPGVDLQPIATGADWVFVLDVSGSMERKFQTLVDGVEKGLSRLRPDDRFRVVLFNNQATEMTKRFLPATPENVKTVVDALRTVRPDNGTNLYDGLRTGLGGLDADRTSAVFLVTDGVANVGETGTRAFVELAAKKDIRLFTFVMGNSANRPLLGAMTRASGGTSFAISNSDDIIGSILSAVGKVGYEALHGISLKIDGVRVTDLTPEQPRNLYRGEQLIVFGKYRGKGEAEVSLSARISGQPVTYRTRFPFPETAARHPEIERLWAFASIEDLLAQTEAYGEDADRKQAVVDLAVENGLVTPYTSMVVVREEVFSNLGIDRHNANRVKAENEARKKRRTTAVTSPRVDTAQPMFTRPAPSHGGSGSGAIDPAMLMLIVLIGLPVLFLVLPAGNRSK